MLSRKEKKKIAAFFGRAEYSYFDDIIENLLIPCGVAAAAAFIVTLLLM